MIKKIYRQKVIKSGSNHIELYDYQNTILKGGTSTNPDGRSKEATEENKELNRIQSINKTKNYVKRLINANYVEGHLKMITLTFKDNVQDIDYMNNELKKWVKRMNYYLGYNMKYIAFRERQLGSRRQDKKGRGALHFHIPVFNIPQYMNLNEIRAFWKHGSTNVKKDLHSIVDLGGYMTSYMDMEHDFFRGRRLFTRSKGLIEPIEEYENNQDLGTELQQLGYSLTYSNEYRITNNDTGEVLNIVRYSKYIKHEILLKDNKGNK